jgi:hypothetical protein
VSELDRRFCGAPAPGHCPAAACRGPHSRPARPAHLGAPRSTRTWPRGPPCCVCLWAHAEPLAAQAPARRSGVRARTPPVAHQEPGHRHRQSVGRHHAAGDGRRIVPAVPQPSRHGWLERGCAQGSALAAVRCLPIARCACCKYTAAETQRGNASMHGLSLFWSPDGGGDGSLAVGARRMAQSGGELHRVV